MSSLKWISRKAIKTVMIILWIRRTWMVDKWIIDPIQALKTKIRMIRLIRIVLRCFIALKGINLNLISRNRANRNLRKLMTKLRNKIVRIKINFCKNILINFKLINLNSYFINLLMKLLKDFRQVKLQ